jgi:hypothetical protein
MTGSNSTESKVERVLEKYGLPDAGAELELRWTRDEDRWSLRDLADWFNKQVLAQAMTDAGMQPIDGEVDNHYRLLIGDEVSEGDRIQLQRRLEQAGLDVDDVLADFVTYQAIRTYLKDVRNATYDAGAKTTPDAVQQRLDRLVGRSSSVAADQLERLRRNDALRVDDFRILVTLQVYCEGCNSQYEIGELIEQGGCDCSEGTGRH